MIYALARLNIYAILLISIEKTERAYFAKLATQAKRDTTNLQSSIINLQFRPAGVDKKPLTNYCCSDKDCFQKK
jgi:hypothetical protein